MSANNYMLIHKIGKKYYIWDNLSAEKCVKNKVLTSENADKSFNTLEETVDWANKNDMTEYGYQINNLHKPKDGYREKLQITKKKYMTNKIFHPLLQNKKSYKGYTVFTFKFNDVPIQFIALRDVKAIVKKLKITKKE
jgi:hypothetical protein